MNELDRLMAEYKPLSEPLDKRETQKLRKRVLSKISPVKKARRLALALAAAMCLLAACGAIAIGLFDSMSNVNRTEEMVEKYSLAFENPPSAAVEGHTVTVQAIIRSSSVARIIYDVTGSQSQISSWGHFINADGNIIRRIQSFFDDQPSGHTDTVPSPAFSQIRQSGPIGEVSGTGCTRYYADVNLPEDRDTVSLYIMSEEGGAEVLQLPLPEQIIADREAVLPDVPFLLDTDSGPMECTIRRILITPFHLRVEGIHEDGQRLLEAEDNTDWGSRIHLYDAEGKELLLGENGNFYCAGGGIGEKDFDYELRSYDLLDPADVAEIEIDGKRYPIR